MLANLWRRWLLRLAGGWMRGTGRSGGGGGRRRSRTRARFLAGASGYWGGRAGFSFGFEQLEPRLLMAVNVTASMTDVLETAGDLDGDGVVDPGETITYRATITETGGTAATNVQFSVTLDPNTTLVEDSLLITPIALDDSYNLVGNTPLAVNVGNGLLANDIDVDASTPFSNAGLSVVPASVTDIGGTATVSGSLTVNADGSFTYTPGTGSTGTDIFTYLIVDADDLQNVTVGIITFNISDPVWYVDSSAAPGGDGSFNNPFQTLTPLNGVGGAGDADAAGSTIFVYESGAAYTTGIQLENNQKLIGESVGLTVNGISIGGSGANPTISNAAGAGITLAMNNTLRGLTIGDTASAGIFGNNFGTLNADTITDTGTGQMLSLADGTLNNITFTSLSTTSGSTGISLSNVAGSFTAGAGSAISGTAGSAIDISGGTVAMTWNGNITQATNFALLSVANHATGTLTFQNGTLSATNGTGLQFDNADGTYNFNGTTTLSGGDAGIDITNGSIGTFGFASASITHNAAGTAFNLNGSNANVTYSGSITDNNGRAVDIDNHDGGTVTFQTGSISASGASAQGIRVANSGGGSVSFLGQTTLSTQGNTAVDLTGNTGSTINFNAAGNGLDITTTSGTGFNATGGGTVTVQGSGNTINSGTGTALNIVNTTIGASDVTFRSISANGAPSGIVLHTTGTLGGLHVTGDGGSSNNGSGGIIQNTTGPGISLLSTSELSLAYMNIQDAQGSLTGQGDGIGGPDTSDPSTNLRAADVRGLTLNHVTISGNGNGVREFGIDILNLSGTVTITNTTVTGSHDDNLRVENTSGTSTVTVTGSTFSNAVEGDGFSYVANGTAQADVDISSTTFSGNFATGVIVGVGDPGATGTVNFDITGGSYTNNNAGIQVIGSGGADVTFTIIDAGPISGNPAAGIAIDESSVSTSAGSMTGTISGNTIDMPAAGSGNGIFVSARGSGDTTITIDDNTITNRTQYGIHVHRKEGDADGSLTATITNNTVTTIDVASDLFFPIDGIRVEAGAASDDAGTLKVDIRDNTVSGAGSQADSPGDDIRLRHRFAVSFQLVGAPLGPLTAAQAIAFVDGNNPDAGTVNATTTSTFTGVAALLAGTGGGRRSRRCRGQ